MDLGGLENLKPIGKFLLLDSQEEIGGPNGSVLRNWLVLAESRKQLLQDPRNISNLQVKSFVSIVWVVPNLRQKGRSDFFKFWEQGCRAIANYLDNLGYASINGIQC